MDKHTTVHPYRKYKPYILGQDNTILRLSDGFCLLYDFDFSIVNFPYTCICSNIQESPAYGVNISPLIKYDSLSLIIFEQH